MRVLVLGNKGMLGHVVERYLKEIGHDVIGLNRGDVNFRHDLALIQKIDEIKPEVVINCAGILITGNDIKEFTDMNILLPHLLAKEAVSSDYRLIHISTNCVFQDIGPHTADETPNATNLYGMSKAFGEINDSHNLTIRTSITGPELKKNGSGLFSWFINQSGDKVTGYKNALWNGVSTYHLAQAIEHFIHSPRTGIVNVFSEETIDKYQLLCDLNEIYNLGKEVTSTFRQDIHSSILCGEELKVPVSIKQQFQEMKEWYEGKSDSWENHKYRYWCGDSTESMTVTYSLTNK